MTDKQFFGSVQGGSIELTLVTLQLEDGHRNRYQGTGRLIWTHEGPHLSAITDGGEQLDKYPGLVLRRTGQIIPNEDYLQLTGETNDGWQIFAERLSNNKWTHTLGSPSVIWDMLSSDFYCGVSLVRPVRTEEVPTTKIVLSGVSLVEWPRQSETEYKNPAFGYLSYSRDWLQTDGGFGQLTAKKLSEDTIFVVIDDTIKQDNDLVYAVHAAFSFYMGKLVRILGYQNTNETEVRRVLPYRNISTTRRFAPPLGIDLELTHFYELFLSKATDFFLTDTGKETSNLLHACWDVADNTFTSRTLITCSIVESLTKLYGGLAKQELVLCREQKEAILELVADEKFLPSFRNRLKGFLDKLHETSAKNVLHAWATQRYCGITFDDISAWNRLRHKSAHGESLWSNAIDRNQETLDRRDKVETMINRIVLGAMGYTGGYRDYFERDYKWMSPALPITVTGEHL